MNKNTQQRNEVTLNGHIGACVISGKKDGKTLALMDVCTVVKDKKSKTGFSEVHHRVGVYSKRKKDIEKIADMCKRNLENIKAGNKDDVVLIPARFNGYINTDSASEPYIEVLPGGFKRSNILKIKNNNVANIQGKVVSATHTDSVAKFVISLPLPDGKKINLPIIVIVNRKDNPEAWSSVANQTVDKDIIVAATGPLLSRKYNNGTESRYTISVLANSFTIEKKLSKFAKINMSM